MIIAPLPQASPSGTGRLSMIIPRYYGLTITNNNNYIIIIIIFFRRVFSECTEAVATSLIH